MRRRAVRVVATTALMIALSAASMFAAPHPKVQVAASSTVAAPFDAAFAIDGDHATPWSSQRCLAGPGCTEWLAFWFNDWLRTDYLRIVPRRFPDPQGVTRVQALPSRFVVYYSANGVWNPVTRNGVPLGLVAMPAVQDHADPLGEVVRFDEVTTNGLLIVSNELRPDSYGGYYFQIAEVYAGTIDVSYWGEDGFSVTDAGGSPKTGLGASGIHPKRGYVGWLPWEHIDMYSGNVVLLFEDIVLPGNAGFDLRVQRSVNVTDGFWRIGINFPMMVLDDPTGASGPQNPVISTHDGAEHYTFRVAGDLYQTATFWRFDRAAHTLSLPSGLVGHYARLAENLVLWRVQRITDPFGNEVRLDYDEKGRLRSIEQDLGDTEATSGATSNVRNVRFTYGEQGLSAIAWAGGEWTYVGGPNGLTRVQPPDGGAWGFERELSTDVTNVPVITVTVTTPQGGQVRYTLKEVVGPTDPETRKGTTRMVLQKREVLHADGPEAWVFWYQSITPLSSKVTTPSGDIRSFEHDTNGRLVLEQAKVSDTIALRSYQYTWTGVGELRSAGTLDNYFAGCAPACAPAHPEAIKTATTTERGVSGQTAVLTTTYTYRDAGTSTSPSASPTYNDYGNPMTVAAGGPFGQIITALEYQHINANGVFRVGLPKTQTVTGIGTVASYTYDASGFATSTVQNGVTSRFQATPRGNVRAAWHGSALTRPSDADVFGYAWGVLSEHQNPAWSRPVTRVIETDGTVASETSQTGTTKFERDGLGREVQRTPPIGSHTATTYTDADGSPSTVTVARGSAWTRTTLDGFGRPLGTENSVGVRTRLEYDPEGRVVFRGDPTAEGHPETGTQLEYDALGRPTVETFADGTSRTMAYDVSAGPYLEDRVTNERGHVTRYRHDAYGSPERRRLRVVVDALGAQTQYTYDALDQLRSVTQPVQLPDGSAGGTVTRTWEYFPGTTLLQREAHPESGLVQCTYNEAGLLATRTDATRTFDYVYDQARRLLEIHHQPAGGSRTLLRRFTWNDAGQRTHATDYSSGVTTDLDYDELGRPRWRTDKWVDSGLNASRTFTTRYTYSGDHLWRVTYPSQYGVQYVRDTEGRIVEIQPRGAGSASFARDIRYHPSGAVASYIAGNGVMTQTTFDARLRPRAVSAGSVLQLTYTYDGAGNPEVVTDARPGYGQSHTYDTVDRLVSSSGKWGLRTYAYDSVGNWRESKAGVSGTSLVPTAYAYEQGTQRLSQAATAGVTTTFAYTPLGQLLTDGVASFTYTPTGLASTVTRLGAQHRYRYDADDQRLASVTGASYVYTLRGADGAVVTEATEAATGVVFTKDYIYLAGRVIAVATPLPGTPGGGGVPAPEPQPDPEPASADLLAPLAGQAGASLHASEVVVGVPGPPATVDATTPTNQAGFADLAGGLLLIVTLGLVGGRSRSRRGPSFFLLFAAVVFLTTPLSPAWAQTGYDAEIAAVSVPGTMTVGVPVMATFTATNTGTVKWQLLEREDGTHATDFIAADAAWGSEAESWLLDNDPVNPSRSKSFTFKLTPPSNPGVYDISVQMCHFDDGDSSGFCFGDVWSGTITVVAPLATYNAQFVSQVVPTTLLLNEKATVRLTFKNTGSYAWTLTPDGEIADGLFAGVPNSGQTWGIDGVLLKPKEAVGPDQTRVFEFQITAPATAGTYDFQWRMGHEDVAANQPFGEASTLVRIWVSTPVVPTALGAAVITEPQVPTKLDLGACPQGLTVVMKNTGSKPWQSEGLANGDMADISLLSTDTLAPGRWNVTGSTVGTPVPLNGTFTVSLPARAPTTAGRYLFQWRMARRVETNPPEWFGAATAERWVDVGQRFAVTVTQPATVTAQPGQAISATATLRNAGLEAWAASHVAVTAAGGGGLPASWTSPAVVGVDGSVAVPLQALAPTTWGTTTTLTWDVWLPQQATCDPASVVAGALKVATISWPVVVPPEPVEPGEPLPARGTTYYHHDALGSVRAVTDATGAVVRRYEYGPYGDLVAGPSQPKERKRFTGQEHDDATGLDYFGARYYRADLGRFTTIDPVYTWTENVVDPQRWNRYSYVRNNPLKYTDPDGRIPVQVSGTLGESVLRARAEFRGAQGVRKAWAWVKLVVAESQLNPFTPPMMAVEDAAVNLAARAKAIHGAVAAGTQARTTIAAARVIAADGSESVMIASSEMALRPAQRAMLQAGEVAVRGAGHAETTAIRAAEASGATVAEVAASRPICPSCADAIAAIGAKATGVLKRVKDMFE